jgi:hypothetical protein
MASITVSPAIQGYAERLSTFGQLWQIYDDNNVLCVLKLVQDRQNISYASSFHHLRNGQRRLLL